MGIVLSADTNLEKVLRLKKTAEATTNNWNGSVSGDGKLTKTGAGQLNLAALTNSY